MSSLGELGHIDDWFLERVELKAGDWSPSLSTLKSVYSKRRKSLASLYSIGHRIRNRYLPEPEDLNLLREGNLPLSIPGLDISYLI